MKKFASNPILMIVAFIASLSFTSCQKEDEFYLPVLATEIANHNFDICQLGNVENTTLNPSWLIEHPYAEVCRMSIRFADSTGVLTYESKTDGAWTKQELKFYCWLSNQNENVTLTFCSSDTLWIDEHRTIGGSWLSGLFSLDKNVNVKYPDALGLVKANVTGQYVITILSKND